MIKFSKGNVKLQRLKSVPALAQYFTKTGRSTKKVYSFDLLSGFSCPFADKCKSKVVVINGKRKVVDGANTEFRCFSASQEATFTNVYNLRKGNFDAMRAIKNRSGMFRLLNDNLPKDAGVVRIHVAGDMFNLSYFDAWLFVAAANPDVLFYAYTKSLRYWVDRLGNGVDTFSIIPDNLILTASRGGREDHLIEQHNLREAVVVNSEAEADKLGYEIDHDDSHAANPMTANQSFALLIHGIQPKGSKASEAIKKLKSDGVEFAYSSTTKLKESFAEIRKLEKKGGAMV
jgi:hypothetical protein